MSQTVLVAFDRRCSAHWRWRCCLRRLRAQEEEKVLNIYNWSDYIAEDTIKNFEKETGIKVRYDNFDNNEIVHAKLVAGKTGYDIVVPSSNWAKLQIDGGLLRKLDKAQLPNCKNLDPAVQAQLARLDPGNDYMVNWLWGFTTVGINVDKVKAALGGTADARQRLGPGVQARVHQQAQELRRDRSSTRPPRSCRPRCTTWASRRSARTRPTTRPRPTC